jgi:hypothetical protein
MPLEKAKRLTPEQVELEKKRARLAELEAELADAELELATLQGSLLAFERRYLNVVGRRYAELDELKARLAEREARLRPKDKAAQEAVTTAQQKAAESAEAVVDDLASAPPRDFRPTDELKKLYREAAKAMHPDLATNDEERARRTRLMAEAYKAYQEGDGEKLQAILREWEASPEAVKGEGPGAELVRTIRKVAQVEDRLKAIVAEVARMKASDLYAIFQKAEEAKKAGREVLTEMAESIDRQIEAVRSRLGQPRSEAGNEPARRRARA